MPKAQKKEGGVEGKLVENLIDLQKVHLGLIEKFDNLSGKIEKLLSLFENAAKNIAEHPAYQLNGQDKELVDKLNQLLAQDKLIAKGITYLEEKVNEIEENQKMMHEGAHDKLPSPAQQTPPPQTKTVPSPKP